MPTTDAVMAWVQRYEHAWREADTDAVADLFADGVHYRHSPYEPDVVGLDALRAEWADPRPFTMTAEPIAVEGARAVVRVTVRYARPDQEYADLWVLRFADDGRVAEFEEWAYWPGRSYTAR